MQLEQQQDEVKLLLIGNSSVGKTSLLLRFSDSRWFPEDEASATIGIDVKVREMEVRGKKVLLSVWDTAGQERYRTITSSYYRGAQGVILVYDVTSRKTFDGLARWYDDIENKISTPVVKVLIGNKVDKESSREVTTSEGEAYARRMDSLFVEASAKTGVGVTEMFRVVVEKILETPEDDQLCHATTATNRL
ncbi:ras-domain-containing protein [Amanita rubescens]|nr:ras-domain-containing protein [Amanita rubescens]